jgi:hypothetical protein
MTAFASVVRRHPIAAYYVLTFVISWGGVLLLPPAGRWRGRRSGRGWHEPYGRSDQRCTMLRKLLLASGVASSLLYVATDILATVRYPGYSYRDQWVSELIATGSPVRPLMIALLTPYNLLVIAFGAGVWLVAGRKRTARLTGAMLIASALTGQLTMLLMPMDARTADATARGSLHGPATAVMSLFTVLAMVFGTTLLGRRFRWYTYATIVTLIVFGVLTSRYLPHLEANEPTPWMGALERVNIYAEMLWVAVLSMALSSGVRAAGARPPSAPVVPPLAVPRQVRTPPARR